jgi:hypothetical protein
MNVVVLESVWKGYNQKPAICSVGSFGFIIDGEEIRFDFMDSYIYTGLDEEGRITLEAELASLDREAFAEWLGIFDEDASDEEILKNIAEEAESIGEVFYECFLDEGETRHVPMQFVSLEIGGTKIDKSLIDDYNRKELKRRLTGS